jgi:hypothetical protein
MAPGKQPTSNKDAYLFRPSHLISKRKRGLICEHSFAMIQSRLNMQHGSIVIIAEHQWNSNAEMQAISRAYRQGQEKVVKAIILDGVNSDIDQIIKVSKTRKMRINRALMDPLIRLPDQGPAKVELLTFPGSTKQVHVVKR